MDSRYTVRVIARDNQGGESAWREQSALFRTQANYAPTTPGTLSATGWGSQTVTATEQDNDVPGLIVSTNSLTVPEGSLGQFTVKLNAQPASSVTVNIAKSSGDADLNASVGSLVFTTANWNVAQAVTRR